MVLVLVVVGLGLGLLGGRVWLQNHPIKPGIVGCLDVRNAASRIECLRDRTLERAREDGAADAALELRNAAGAKLPTECHLAMHELGERAGKGEVPSDFAADWKRVGLDEQATCDQGWIHGFLAVAFVGVPTSELPAALENCTKVIDRPGECDHALGHVFVRAAKGDGLIEGLEACTALGPEFDAVDGGRGAAQRTHDCQHGAVMEDALEEAGEAIRSPIRAKVDDAPTARRNCYEFLAARVVLLGGGWDDAARRCEDLDSDGDRDDCRNGWLTAAPDRATCADYPDGGVRTTCRERRP